MKTIKNKILNWFNFQKKCEICRERINNNEIYTQIMCDLEYNYHVMCYIKEKMNSYISIFEQEKETEHRNIYLKFLMLFGWDESTIKNKPLKELEHMLEDDIQKITTQIIIK